jgi:hypothetical protein
MLHTCLNPRRATTIGMRVRQCVCVCERERELFALVFLNIYLCNDVYECTYLHVFVVVACMSEYMRVSLFEFFLFICICHFLHSSFAPVVVSWS